MATIVRILWVLYIPNFPISDFATYQKLAVNVSKGWGHILDGAPVAFQGAAYPILLGWVYKLIGITDIIAGKFLNIILSISTLVIIYFLLKKIFKNNYIIYSSYTLISFLPNYIAYNNVIGTEVFTVFLLAVIIFLQIYFTNNYKKYVVTGLFIGVAALAKPIFMAYPLVIGAIYWGRTKNIKKSMVTLLFSLAGMMVIFTPWMIRNYIAFDSFFPVSYNGGYVLYINNNEQNISGGYMDIKQVTPSAHLLSQLKERDFEYGVHHPQVESLYKQEAFRWIVRNPLKFLELGFLRLANTFFSGAWDINVWTMNQEQLANKFNHSLAFKRTFAVISSINSIIISLLSICGLLYVIVYFKYMFTIFKRKETLPINVLLPYIHILFFAAIYFVYEGQPRYNFPLLFILGICTVVLVQKVYTTFNKK